MIGTTTASVVSEAAGLEVGVVSGAGVVSEAGVVVV